MPVDWGTIKPLFVLRADWREQLRSLFVFEERPLLIDHEAWLVKSAAKPREASRSIRTEVLNLLDDHAEDWRRAGPQPDRPQPRSPRV